MFPSILFIHSQPEEESRDSGRFHSRRISLSSLSYPGRYSTSRSRNSSDDDSRHSSSDDDRSHRSSRRHHSDRHHRSRRNRDSRSRRSDSSEEDSDRYGRKTSSSKRDDSVEYERSKSAKRYRRWSCLLRRKGKGVVWMSHCCGNWNQEPSGSFKQ